MAPEILAFSDVADLLAQLTAKARRLGSSVGWSVSACRVDTGDPHQDAEVVPAPWPNGRRRGRAPVLIGATRPGWRSLPGSRNARARLRRLGGGCHDRSIDRVETRRACCSRGQAWPSTAQRDRAVLTVAGGVFDSDEVRKGRGPATTQAGGDSVPYLIVRSEAKPPQRGPGHSKRSSTAAGRRELEDLELVRRLRVCWVARWVAPPARLRSGLVLRMAGPVGNQGEARGLPDRRHLRRRPASHRHSRRPSDRGR